MKRITISIFLLSVAFLLKAQKDDSTTTRLLNLDNYYVNTAEKLLMTDGRLKIGGYGGVHYNQPFDKELNKSGNLDVHRFIMMLGYQFNERTQFISEIEYEHVKEVFIEQAFIQYKINNYLNFRGGLLLVPMGLINEYHEPTTFNGVERPDVDNKITPTTWREVGVGFSGNILPAFIKYQAYIVNGFNGYDGTAMLNGNNGFRSGRQKGAESYINTPNLTGKIEYYGVRGLNIGISGYFGKTQTSLYNNSAKNDEAVKAIVDSSIVGISMIGIDTRYNIKGLQLRGQFYYTRVSNTDQYNLFTADENGIQNDLGSSMTGYYIEAGYNVFRPLSVKSELIPFIRYEGYNTHNSVEGRITPNKAYNKTIITSGVGWKITKGAVLKADFQFVKSEVDNSYSKIFNAGFGVIF